MKLNIDDFWVMSPEAESLMTGYLYEKEIPDIPLIWMSLGSRLNFNKKPNIALYTNYMSGGALRNFIFGISQNVEKFPTLLYPLSEIYWPFAGYRIKITEIYGNSQAWNHYLCNEYYRDDRDINLRGEFKSINQLWNRDFFWHKDRKIQL